MALISLIPVGEVAAVVARSLEELLGHDVVVAPGEARVGEPDAAILPPGPTRTVVLPFAAGSVGELTLVVAEPFATAMEAATPDASLTTAALPSLEAGAAAIALTLNIGVSAADAGEIATETLLTSVVGEFAGVPLFENEVPVACVVVRIVDDEPVEAGMPLPAAAPAATHSAPPEPPPAPPLPPLAPPAPIEAAPAPVGAAVSADAGAAPAAPVPAGTGIAVHEFQPLADGLGSEGSPRPIALLNDVNMEITAELGRGRLKVRDVVALRPGTVIELDRAAGSPVDVLVNGALVWHGEVVVVDDEFGIRVSDIVTGDG